MSPYRLWSFSAVFCASDKEPLSFGKKKKTLDRRGHKRKKNGEVIEERIREIGNPLWVLPRILVSKAAFNSDLPFADPVRSCLQHSSDGVGDGCPAQLWSQGHDLPTHRCTRANMCMPACLLNSQPASQLWPATSDSPSPKLQTTSLFWRSLRRTYPWFGQLLDFIHFRLGDDVDVANDVGAVPLVLLLNRRQHKPRVVFVVVVTTEQPALSARCLR